MNKGTVVLDASALLAFFHREAGSDVVENVLRQGSVCMSAVNYAEVVIKHVAKGKDAGTLRELIRKLGIVVIAFDESSAEAVARLKPKTTAWGLSMADCACLTLAKQLDALALTADTEWANLKDECDIKLIRNRNTKT